MPDPLDSPDTAALLQATITALQDARAQTDRR